MTRFLSRDEVRELTAKLLDWSRADECRVSYRGGWSGNVRFARNEPTTSGSVEDGTVVVQSVFGRRVANATTNTFADESLHETLDQSERLAQLAPDDPEYLPELGAQEYASVPAYFEETAGASPEARALVVGEAIARCRAAGDLIGAGFLRVAVGAEAIANSKGLFAYHPSTNASYTLTVRTADGTGSGWAGAGHPDWSRIDASAVTQRAADKAAASRDPVALDPGRYTVILEPQAVGDLVQLLSRAADARISDEGRGAFTREGGGNRIGEMVADQRVTLLSDPGDPDLLSTPFDQTGLPLGQEVWIRDGVLQNLIYSRFWAERQQKRVTGFPNSIKLVGTATSLDTLIRDTRRGVLVTRLWYLRQVDPRTVLYTGLTRDGTFLIEEGRISKAIKNFRFNDSPLFLLNNVEALGEEARLAGTEAGGAIVMPALRARDFAFTSLSDAV